MPGQVKCGGARLWWVWIRAALGGPDVIPKENASAGRSVEWTAGMAKDPGFCSKAARTTQGGSGAVSGFVP